MILKVLVLNKYRNVNLECSRVITFKYTRSFSFAISTFDRKTRNSIYALYSFLRYTDEIIDSLNGFDQQLLFDEFKKDTYKAIERRISTNPILDAFQSVVNEYQLDLGLIDSFFSSMFMDLETLNYDKNRYKKYIYGSAEVPGLLCLKIVSWPNIENYTKYSVTTQKVAATFQKINFLRDLKEDTITNNRDYLYCLKNEGLFDQKSKCSIEKEITENLNLVAPKLKNLPKHWKLGAFIAYNSYAYYFKKIKRKSPENLLDSTFSMSFLKKVFIFLISLSRITLSV